MPVAAVSSPSMRQYLWQEVDRQLPPGQQQQQQQQQQPVAPPPAGSPPAHATTCVFNDLCYLTARTTPAVEASGPNEPYPDRRSVRVPRIHSRWHAGHRAPRDRRARKPCA